MNKFILKVVVISITAIGLLTSCKNEETLQQYYVSHQDSEGFVTTSIPKTIAGIDANQLSSESANAYNSIKKVNILALPLTDENKGIFDEESKRLEDILTNDKYELLVSHNSNGTKIKMMYDGTQQAIDEIIIYGKSPEMGMGVARVLGDDMNLGEIMKMMKELENQDINPTNIESVLKGMGLPMQNVKIDPI